ncbi:MULTISPECIES: helix-turn-helix domain-containing protein [Alistipes]|uniref:helix-turn-helix domain-containing protein n=2 Tax=Rikenellaceae TaxID=171550 RepID=UPI00241E9B86|nr:MULTISPECIES: helix-turn-helix domain-containing protein [Alistipes]MDD7039553.1 helix-turn-helix domain-containing protein [Alistipes senegalensis]
MNKKDQVNALISYFSNGNKTAFASKLGLKPQSINNWIARNTFDADLIFSKCDGISAEWLLTGKGDMLINKTETQREDSVTERSHIQELIQIIQNQAKALLEQQQFINAHFPKSERVQIFTPPLDDKEKYPDIEHFKE